MFKKNKNMFYNNINFLTVFNKGKKSTKKLDLHEKFLLYYIMLYYTQYIVFPISFCVCIQKENIKCNNTTK